MYLNHLPVSVSLFFQVAYCFDLKIEETCFSEIMTASCQCRERPRLNAQKSAHVSVGEP